MFWSCVVVFSYLFYDRLSGVEGAMEWLLIHESDPDIDEPLEIPVETRIQRQNPVRQQQDLTAVNHTEEESLYPTRK